MQSLFKSKVWPVYPHESKKVIAMSILLFAVVFNYTILRDTKDALIVNAAGAGAITFLKSYCVTPAAFIFVVTYTYMANFISREKLFYITILPFLTFFGLFGFVLYPNVELLHPSVEKVQHLYNLAPTMKGFINIYAYWVYSLFYIVSELWGSAMVTVCFWQFANFIVRLDESKRIYGVFILIGNLSLLISGPIIMLCSQTVKYYFTSEVEAWGVSLKLLMSAVVIMGCTAVYVFRWLHVNILKDSAYDYYTKSELFNVNAQQKQKKKIGLLDSFRIITQSNELILILILVLAYGITLNLIEVQWKHQLGLFTNGDRGLYNSIMGFSSFAQGIMSIFVGFIGIQILQKAKWYNIAVITPIIFLIGGCALFMFVLSKYQLTKYLSPFNIDATYLAVMLGFVVLIVVKPVKYTLFDTAKEMAFIPLNPHQKSQGKVAVDVMGARVGKGSGSLIQTWLLVGLATSDVMVIAPSCFIIFLLIASVWIYAVKLLAPMLSVDAETPVAQTELKAQVG